MSAMKGIVIKNTGNTYLVRSDGVLYAGLKGIFA
jgi:hypothetical protein